MIRLWSAIQHLFYTVIDLHFLHYWIYYGAFDGYYYIYVSDVIVTKPKIGVFRKLKRVATRFKRQ